MDKPFYAAMIGLICITAGCFIGVEIGSKLQLRDDQALIKQAQEDENQISGLNDVCTTELKHLLKLENAK